MLVRPTVGNWYWGIFSVIQLLGSAKINTSLSQDVYHIVIVLIKGVEVNGTV